MKRIKTLILPILLILLLTNCGSVSPTYIPKREVKNFDWTPPTTAQPRSADLSIILINPRYMAGFEDENDVIFKKFAKNMSADFEEAIVAKGYSLRGPYDTYDEVVFSDKSETDLMMAVEIDFNYEFANNAVRKHADLVSVSMGREAYKYSVNGELYLGGKINLVVYESMTKEKLWVKSIKLSDKALFIRTGKHRTVDALEGDPGFLNPLTEALDEYYQQSLKTAWNHLDPRELLALKRQVKELRSKKGY